MFNIGPAELLVLVIVGLIVLGPDRLPNLARDAARMIKTLREMATGARTQLKEELGPEFADMDLQGLRNLNPRTALQRAILGDEDLSSLNPKRFVQDAMSADPPPVPMGKPDLTKPEPPRQRPLGRDEPAPYDSDAT